jgi:hypothetical protein
MEWKQPGADDPEFQRIRSMAMEAADKLKALLGENGRVIVALAIEDGARLTYSVSSVGPALSVIGLLECTRRAVEKQKVPEHL